LRVSNVGVSEDIVDTPPQGQRERHAVELAPKEGKMGSGEGFGEDVDKLVTTGQEVDIKCFGGNHITNKVKVNFHVFFTSVEHRIGR